MLFFPNCKINLGLNITGKRADEFHNIETVFYPVQLRDALEIINSTNHSQLSAPAFTHTGLIIEGEENDNLCLKAYFLLKKDFPLLPAVKIHLHKVIPMGAGLGGGSADAAFTLIGLNQKYALNLSDDQLLSYALKLGSDCPFFIINKPCIAKGRGEILQYLDLTLSGYRLILVHPGIHVNTSWAFSQPGLIPGDLTAKEVQHQSLQTIISQPIPYWKDELRNDFEKPVFEKYPAIKAIKEILYKSGALFASMSGSGSSVYGIFENNTHPCFNFPEKYLLYNILL